MYKDLKIVRTFILSVIVPPLLLVIIVLTGGNTFPQLMDEYQPLLMVFLLGIGVLPLVLLKVPPGQKLMWYIAYLPATATFTIALIFLVYKISCAFNYGCEL